MIRTLTSLLMSTALLLVGHGMQLTLRAAALGQQECRGMRVILSGPPRWTTDAFGFRHSL